MKPIIEIIVTALQLYVYVLVAAAIFSWLYAFNVVNTRNPVVATIGDTLYRLTEPVLRRVRRVMPDLGGLDLSPVVVILLIWLVQAWLKDYIWPIVP